MTMDWTAQGGNAAEVYERFLVPAMFVPFAAAMLDAVGVPDGARVLDVACGTGAVARDAARRAGPAGAVTGVDFGDGMLAVARTRPAQDGAAPIEYLAGPADALPVPDGTFDLVTCHHGLQFFPDRPAALAEMRRALRPGGRVAVATWSALADQPHFAALAGPLATHLGPEAAAGIGAPFAHHDPEVAGAEFEQAGFVDVDARIVTLPVTFASFSEFPRLMLLAGPLSGPFGAAAPETQLALVEEIGAALADHRAADDTLASRMSTVLVTATAQQ